MGWSHPQRMPQAWLADLRVPPTVPKPSVPTCGKFPDFPALKRLRSVHATAAGFGGREPEADGHNPQAVAPLRSLLRAKLRAKVCRRVRSLRQMKYLSGYLSFAQACRRYSRTVITLNVP